MNVDDFFYSHPVFRYEEFTDWKIKQGTSHPRAVRSALLYHTKAGHVLNVRRGIYAVVPPTEAPGSLSVDPYLALKYGSCDTVPL
ncbi:MAG: hypothetical protein EPO11_03465 [Gammaproteobacteria bacterium]|nr:MAG: hypothetical protein EPO11_03465 [Gammaproteobacteria bacterium]